MSNQERFRTSGEHIPETTYKGIPVPELPPAILEVRGVSKFLQSFEHYTIPTLEFYLARVLEQQAPNLSAKPASQSVKDKVVDYAIAAHGVMKTEGPDAVLALAANIDNDFNGYASAEVDGPFINIRQEPVGFAERVMGEVQNAGELYGTNNDGLERTVVLDVSSPNIAKEMHLGHLRSTVIGEALSRIMSANGYRTIRDNHLGDWGTQFGTLAHAYNLWHEEIPELDNPETQVAGLQKLYIKINSAIEEQKEASRLSSILKLCREIAVRGQIDITLGEEELQAEIDRVISEQEKAEIDAIEGDSALLDEGRKWFTKLENGDEEAIALWQWARDLSMLEFEKVYQTLGINFEYLLGESVYSGMSSDLCAALVAAGLAEEDEKGRLCLIPSKKGLSAKVIRRSDGSSLYSTRDLSCLIARCAWFNPAKMIYVVGAEQTSYFKEVFDGFEQFAGEDSPELVHVGFGAIELDEGKMSTRKGNVIPLVDVLDEAYKQALNRVTINAEKRQVAMSAEEVAEIARQVAVGAVIYYDLKQGPGRKITFDWDEILSFEGNSGPYLQYATARMNGLLQRSLEEQITFEAFDVRNLDLQGNEGEIIRIIAEYPLAVRQAALKYDPSQISGVLYKLAHAFNAFYSESSVFDEEDVAKRNARLALISCAHQTLKNGLDLLNIPTPARV